MTKLSLHVGDKGRPFAPGSSRRYLYPEVIATLAPSL